MAKAAKHPADVIPQLDAMRMGADYRFILRSRAFSMDARPLTIDETIQMTADVIVEMQRLPEHSQNSQFESACVAKKTLVLASTSEPGAKDPKITEYVLGRMTPEELQYLYKQWVDGCASVSPALETLSPDVLQALIETVKKNGPSTLIQLSRSQLCAMVDSLLSSGD